MNGITTTINGYDDFVKALLETGFAIGTDGSEGLFSLADRYGAGIRWHTGDPGTDPWEWRMLVLEERNDIAYAKVFFQKGGFFTRLWYPCFLAVRRRNESFEDAYQRGAMSVHAKRIHEIVADGSHWPVHEIKRQAGITKEDNGRFERALLDLQTRMYITICGRARKLSALGEEYGWHSTSFCTAEAFFGEEALEEAAEIGAEEAAHRIIRRMYEINPTPDEKKLKKFINA